MKTETMTIEEWRTLLPVYQNPETGMYGWKRSTAGPAFAPACVIEESR